MPKGRQHRERRSREQILRDVKRAAKELGGDCLTKTYRPVTQDWRFRCARGHVFSRPANLVEGKGRWCSKCEQEDTVERVKDAAAEWGGACETSTWRRLDQNWTFRCENNHRLMKPANRVMRFGFQCQKCIAEEKLQAIHANAEATGGRCLDRVYRGARHKMRFVCANGHRLTRSAKTLLEKELWCDKCVAQTTFEKVSKEASRHDLTCVQEPGLGYGDIWEFECHEGHRFTRRPDHLLTGQVGCPECSKAEVLEDLRRIAAEKNGKLVTKRGGTTKSQYKFRCAEGHTFTRKGTDVIHRGLWCNHCTGRAKGSMLSKVREAAKRRGGRCLSKDYVARPGKMTFECEHGHRWKALASHILYNDKWCPTCATHVSAGFVQKLESAIASNGGKMVKKSVGKATAKHQFICREGHRFLASPTHVVNRGAWCPRCAQKERSENSRVGIETVKEIALEYGGQCLSADYKNARQKGHFRCANGHDFKIRFDSVLYDNAWCPTCWNEERRVGLDAAKEIAEEWGGECLSTEYLNARQMAHWRCEEGHEWETRFTNVLHQGNWCPECALAQRSELRGQPHAQHRRLAIEDCHSLAERNNGLCLTGYYVNYEYPMAWRCERKHEWIASLHTMEFRDNFCLECADIEARQRKLQEVSEWAGSFGGRVLSKEYIDRYTPLRWECSRNHRWDLSYQFMLNRDAFCTECVELERKAEYLDRCKAHAEREGGKCLSTEWTGAQSKMKWQCKNKHLFTASWNQAKLSPFCGQCAREEKFQHDGARRLREIAKQHGGRWIESRYRGASETYRFECKKGKRFSATPNSAKQYWHKGCECTMSK